MATQQSQSTNSTSAYTKSGSSTRIPANASAERAAQILGYGIGDTVMLAAPVTSDLSSGGTSAPNTPNSTQGPGMSRSGSEMANLNAGYSSGNSALNPEDSHQASMSNAAPGQRFLVSRFDDVQGQFYAYKLHADGTHDNTEAPLAADENYQPVNDLPEGIS